MCKEAEERIDQVFATAFETNHPAMLDWVAIKFELRDLRAKVAEQNTSTNSAIAPFPCKSCTLQHKDCREKLRCDRYVPNIG